MFSEDENNQIEEIEKRCINSLFEDGGLFEQSTLLFESISTNAELIAYACIKRNRDIFIAISHMKKYSDQQVISEELPILPNPIVDISFRSCLETAVFGWWILNNPERTLAVIKKDWEIRQAHSKLISESFDEVEYDIGNECHDPISLYKGNGAHAIDLDELKAVNGLPTLNDMILEIERDLETKVGMPIYKILSHYSTHTTLSSLLPYMSPGTGYNQTRIDESTTDFFRINLYGFTTALLNLLVIHLNLNH